MRQFRLRSTYYMVQNMSWPERKSKLVSARISSYIPAIFYHISMYKIAPDTSGNRIPGPVIRRPGTNHINFKIGQLRRVYLVD